MTETETGHNQGLNMQLHKVMGGKWTSRLGHLLHYLVGRVGRRKRMDMERGVDVLLCDLFGPLIYTIWTFWDVYSIMNVRLLRLYVSTRRADASRKGGTNTGCRC